MKRALGERPCDRVDFQLASRHLGTSVGSAVAAFAASPRSSLLLSPLPIVEPSRHLEPSRPCSSSPGPPCRARISPSRRHKLSQQATSAPVPRRASSMYPRNEPPRPTPYPPMRPRHRPCPAWQPQTQTSHTGADRQRGEPLLLPRPTPLRQPHPTTLLPSRRMLPTSSRTSPPRSPPIPSGATSPRCSPSPSRA